MSTDREVTRVYARYRYIRRVLVAEAQEPGEARMILRELFDDAAFAEFWRIRIARYVATVGYKAWKHKYNQRHYENVVRAQRSAPESRARLAQRRRELRAVKRKGA